MRSRLTSLALGLTIALGLLALGIVHLWTGTPAPSATAAVTDTKALPATCSNEASTWPAGTPVETIAASVQPSAALDGVWHYINTERRFVGWSPVPNAPNDYRSTTTILEAIWLCLDQPGSFTRPDVGR